MLQDQPRQYFGVLKDPPTTGGLTSYIMYTLGCTCRRSTSDVTDPRQPVTRSPRTTHPCLHPSRDIIKSNLRRGILSNFTSDERHAYFVLFEFSKCQESTSTLLCSTQPPHFDVMIQFLVPVEILLLASVSAVPIPAYVPRLQNYWLILRCLSTQPFNSPTGQAGLG